VNISLALFNMIPFGIFDGRKVWAWNKLVYLGMVIATLLLLILYVAPQLIPSINPAPF